MTETITSPSYPFDASSGCCHSDKTAVNAVQIDCILPQFRVWCIGMRQSQYARLLQLVRLIFINISVFPPVCSKTPGESLHQSCFAQYQVCKEMFNRAHVVPHLVFTPFFILLALFPLGSVS